MRALGLPNLAFILYMAANLVWLAIQYEDHDEHWFVFNLQFACAGGLFYVCYFLFSFATNALTTVRSRRTSTLFIPSFLPFNDPIPQVTRLSNSYRLCLFC